MDTLSTLDHAGQYHIKSYKKKELFTIQRSKYLFSHFNSLSINSKIMIDIIILLYLLSQRF